MPVRTVPAPTRPMARIAASLAAITGLAACNAYADRNSFVSDAPAARVVGQPVSCLSASRIRSTVVHDDRTIDFEVTGGDIYRNTLPNRCPRLGFERSISYDIRGGRLCSPEFIYPLESIGGGIERGVGCGLGEFVPVELVRDDPA